MLVDRVELGERDDYARAFAELQATFAYAAEEARALGLNAEALAERRKRAKATLLARVRADVNELANPPKPVVIGRVMTKEEVDVFEAALAPGFITALPSTNTIATVGAYVYAHSTPVYRMPVVTPPPVDSWVGTDETGYTSAKLNSRIMPVGDKWWVQLGSEWLSEYGGVVEFPSARMAREQVERRREAERG
jgi:hypothetical protein